MNRSERALEKLAVGLVTVLAIIMWGFGIVGFSYILLRSLLEGR